jgi:hypothetical protein
MIWASHQAKDQPELRFFFLKKKVKSLYNEETENP